MPPLPAIAGVQSITGAAAPARTAVMRRSISAEPRCGGLGAGVDRIRFLGRRLGRAAPGWPVRRPNGAAGTRRRAARRQSTLADRRRLWRLLPLHVERDRNAIDSLARLDHVLRGLGILLEVRRLQMCLERLGILVDFE